MSGTHSSQSVQLNVLVIYRVTWIFQHLFAFPFKFFSYFCKLSLQMYQMFLLEKLFSLFLH